MLARWVQTFPLPCLGLCFVSSCVQLPWFFRGSPPVFRLVVSSCGFGRFRLLHAHSGVRIGEASNPGPPGLAVANINCTHMSAHLDAILDLGAHYVFLQEHSLPPRELASLKLSLRRTAYTGVFTSLDPECQNPTGGVAVLALHPHRIYAKSP